MATRAIDETDHLYFECVGGSASNGCFGDDEIATVWMLTIEGEGEHPESFAGSETKAIEWAENLIAHGDYDVAEGETTIVRYHLRRGDMQVDRHVDIEG